MKRDYYENAADVPWATARQANSIVPSDAANTSDLTTKGLLIVADGDLELHAVESDDALPPFAVVAGQIVPIQCLHVKTGTTATVVGLG